LLDLESPSKAEFQVVPREVFVLHKANPEIDSVNAFNPPIWSSPNSRVNPNIVVLRILKSIIALDAQGKTENCFKCCHRPFQITFNDGLNPSCLEESAFHVCAGFPEVTFGSDQNPTRIDAFALCEKLSEVTRKYCCSETENRVQPRQPIFRDGIVSVSAVC
jgi:hypothetical protein